MKDTMWVVLSGAALVVTFDFLPPSFGDDEECRFFPTGACASLASYPGWLVTRRR